MCQVSAKSENLFFYMEILFKIFPNLKLEIEFHSHKKVVSPKLENCAHLYIMKFMCAKFKQNQRTFFFTWKSFVNFSQLSNLESDFFLILQKNLQCSKIFEIYLSWTSSEPIFCKIREPFLIRREVGGYHGCRRGCQERGVVVRGTARARLALSFFPSSSLSSYLFLPSFFSFFSFLFFS